MYPLWLEISPGSSYNVSSPRKPPICQYLVIFMEFQASGKELERKSRKLRWKEFIETPELDDQDEKKAEELQRLITIWRTSDKRREMYKDMENMEVK